MNSKWFMFAVVSGMMIYTEISTAQSSFESVRILNTITDRLTENNNMSRSMNRTVLQLLLQKRQIRGTLNLQNQGYDKKIRLEELRNERLRLQLELQRQNH